MIKNLENLSALVVIFAISMLMLERFFPLRNSRARLISRLTVNISLSTLTFIVAFFVVRPIVNYIFNLPQEMEYGILNLIELNAYLRILFSFLLLDLSFYYWHRANHTIPLLWRFHNVHHFDPDLDVTTGARFHPGEVLISSLFRIFQILLIGVTLYEYLLYEFIFQLATFFHHSNLRLPQKTDSALSILIVTPKVHGIHHSNYKDETNSNYGVVFSFWDRLHKSFKYKIPIDSITMGVPGYPTDKYNTIVGSLTAPFLKQEDYWVDDLGKDYSTRFISKE